MVNQGLRRLFHKSGFGVWGGAPVSHDGSCESFSLISSRPRLFIFQLHIQPFGAILYSIWYIRLYKVVYLVRSIHVCNALGHISKYRFCCVISFLMVNVCIGFQWVFMLFMCMSWVSTLVYDVEGFIVIIVCVFWEWTCWEGNLSSYFDDHPDNDLEWESDPTCRWKRFTELLL